MRNSIIVTIFCLFISCEQKEKNSFSLKYIRNDNELSLIFENDTEKDIIFLTPNTLEVGDKNFKDISTQGNMEGSYPITVYATIKDNQFFKILSKNIR
ncbi:hypothetical protein MP477_02595 [Chryseobacterium sp. WG23]|uniref:hypothetical protein n=1 Tax=Chryseobacterium sp. WG23 TaxID=2926910 RepID=UPI00211F3614|nr:hypothetical protein [Chryseobacterium sp. WG23]MCQ9633842.1 hypothetical protein [Chryseobacterium sp. WG23]